MYDDLDTVKNFIMSSVREPDKFIDDIHIVTENYEMSVSNKSQNGYTVKYETSRDFTTISLASKLSAAYDKDPLKIFNEIVRRPKNILIFGSSYSIRPIYFKNCVFLCDSSFETISICEDCVFER